MDIHEFIETRGITGTSVKIDGRPCGADKWSKDATHWAVTLRIGGNGTGKGPETGRMTVLYSMGSAHKGRPGLADVLDCIASDCSGLGCGFEDWAASYGYDPDSRKAEKVYQTIVEQDRQLRAMLGREAYRELVEEVERL